MQRTSAVSKTERIARTGWVGGFTVSSGIKKNSSVEYGQDVLNVFRHDEPKEQVTDKMSHVSITLSAW